MIGTDWLQNRPSLLETAYDWTERLLKLASPVLELIGWQRWEPIFQFGERLTKEPLFDCRMCGMCNLRGTGMTCPMSCPKEMRNGPCGGVRPDGKCEVNPEMDCVWRLGWERSAKMETYGDRILLIHAPVDRQLEGTSAWLNTLRGIDRELPAGWNEGPALVFDKDE